MITAAVYLALSIGCAAGAASLLAQDYRGERLPWPWTGQSTRYDTVSRLSNIVAALFATLSELQLQTHTAKTMAVFISAAAILAPRALITLVHNQRLERSE